MFKILAVIATMFSAASAYAQNVYDSTNTMLGPLVGTWFGTAGLVTTKLNGNYHFLLVGASGVVNTNGYQPLLFELSGCQGRPYLPYNPSTDIVPLALFDGHTIWAIDTRGAKSYLMKSYKMSQACVAYGQLTNVAAAPAVSTNMMFSGPLSLR